MDLDLVLAIAHHLAVFSLAGIFAAEFALVRPGLAGPRIGQLARIDAAYGAVAGLVLVVGILRVIYGASGWDYYSGNWAFWAKMAAVAVVGLLSIPPTLAFRRWSKAARDNANYAVPSGEVTQQRRYVHLQAAVLLLVPAFAAAMARGYGA